MKGIKCPDPDNILNELLKYSPQNILELYTDTFNVILKCGVVQQQWCIGYIRPLYKNKGNPNDPNNYRGITITITITSFYACFIDYKKVFYSIQRPQLWMKLCNLEIQGQLFNVIYDTYKKVRSCVSYGGQCSDFFPWEMGVRQGITFHLYYSTFFFQT